MLSTTTKGKIAEHRFVSEFLKRGYQVFLPIDERSIIDMIIVKDEKMQQVQVKYRKRTKYGCLRVYNRTSNPSTQRRYTKEEIDLFAVYDPKGDKGYLVPFSVFDERIAIDIRVAPYKHGKTGNQYEGHQGENYEFF